MVQEAEQSTIEEIRKEQIVEGEIKEYATKDKITEETVRNYLSMLATHYLQITLLTERAYKDIL